jgi:hypothetical protein
LRTYLLYGFRKQAAREFLNELKNIARFSASEAVEEKHPTFFG